ncbi:lanthionine synthetase LanC family protein [Gemmatimonas sp.]|uniref:lanthionine synthetase LanC family protein n=1 Tax=Gemmatimonas sp. TaxID=1962908 RepID=UPI00286DD2BB|nr:lanthionine synthetase LanC family protein [Gemmatimonas sp.]
MGLDIYEGAAGVSLFLSTLSHLMDEAEQREVACAAARSVAAAAETAATGAIAASTGLFSGSTGTLYAIASSARSLDEPVLTLLVERLLDGWTSSAARSDSDDVISGDAGAIPTMIRLNRRFKRSTVDAWLRDRGSRLLERATRLPEGWCWSNEGRDELRPFLGYAHGASGYAVALAELAHYFGDSTYAYGAERAMAYEDYHFDESQASWPDFRMKFGGWESVYVSRSDAQSALRRLRPNFMNAWCHGAPGIGLARWRCRSLIGSAGHPLAIPRALSATLRTLPFLVEVGNPCLCHGAAGNLVAAHRLARVLGDSASFVLVEQYLDRFLNRLETQGEAAWGCQDAPSLPPNYGLMTGMAGVAFGLLALIDRAPPLLIGEDGNEPVPFELSPSERSAFFAQERRDRFPTVASSRDLSALFAMPFSRSTDVHDSSAREEQVTDDPIDLVSLGIRLPADVEQLRAELAELYLSRRNPWQMMDGWSPEPKVSEIDTRTRRLRASPLICVVVSDCRWLLVAPTMRQLTTLEPNTAEWRVSIHTLRYTSVDRRPIGLLAGLVLVAAREPQLPAEIADMLLTFARKADPEAFRSVVAQQIRACRNAGALLVD